MSKPINGAMRKRPRKRPHHIPQDPPTKPGDPRFRLIDVDSISTPRRKPGAVVLPRGLQKRPLVAGPGGRIFTQKPNLPAQPGQVGIGHLLQGSLPAGATELPSFTDDHSSAGDLWDPDWGISLEEIEEARFSYRVTKKDRQRKRRERQFARWQAIVIPALIPLFLEVQRRTQSGRLSLDVRSQPDAHIVEPPPCQCVRKVRIVITKVRWDGFSNSTLSICQCRTAAHQLLASGYFPCAPVRPSLAVDINLLDLISTNSLYLAPNVTGWADTLIIFWRQRGYILGPEDSLRRRLGNALQWYQVLVEAVRARVEGVIIRDNTFDSTLRPSAEDSLLPALEASTVPLVTLPSRSEQNPSASPPTSGNKPLTRPSAYLRGCCPLCFGGDRPTLENSPSDVLVCLDANFSQKCRRTAHQDPPFFHPRSAFLSPEVVAAMEAEVEAARGTKSKPSNRRSEGRRPQIEDENEVEPIHVPDSVLDECEKTFIAAQENVMKASKDFYADTGLMALLCRHDHLLWVANLTTAGEKQHYAFALLKQLFSHLPVAWTVGFLYDIACQLHRSMLKHSILPHFHDRLTFSVSIFHAYGHQWPCQLIYHPRKCKGFGLTDGEGCERFWSALRRLIPPLRVSGRHRRLFILDLQMGHMQRESLRTLGKWVSRRRKVSQSRSRDAALRLENALRAADITEVELQSQWAAQVEAQTRKFQRHSKHSVDQTIEYILYMREDIVNLRSELKTLKEQQVALAGDDTISRSKLQDEIDAIEIHLETTKTKLRNAEKALGVTARQRLEKLKGNGYMGLRTNARALKARVRAQVINHKFEREKLERVYRHKVMQDKEQSQVKTVLQRTRRGVGSLVTRFNKLIDQMEALKDAGEAPHRSRLPQRLDAKKLFRLDVDDDIWNDSGLGGLDEEDVAPRWLADEDVRQGIIALLERDRCVEEEERLGAEVRAMQRWLREETMDVRTALSAVKDDLALAYQLKVRLQYLSDVGEKWRRTIQLMGIDDEWMQCGDLSGTGQTRACHSHGELDSDNDDLFSSDDGGSEDEVESIADEDDNVDDLIENLLTEDVEEPLWAHGNKHQGNNVSSHHQRNSATTFATCEPDKQSGLYWCTGSDIESVARLNAWINGRAIMLYAETVVQECGDARHADHLPAQALVTVREYLDAGARGDKATQAKCVRSLAHEVAQAGSPQNGRPWLVPVHVRSHWTLAVIQWDDARIRYCDSLPRREWGAQDEQEAQVLMWGLLKILMEHFGITLQLDRFTWLSENRGMRQHNSYDCGVFVSADMDSFIRWGRVSAVVQSETAGWRVRMFEALQKLPERTRG